MKSPGYYVMGDPRKYIHISAPLESERNLVRVCVCVCVEGGIAMQVSGLYSWSLKNTD
jgi:hypothetical protein